MTDTRHDRQQDTQQATSHLARSGCSPRVGVMSAGEVDDVSRLLDAVTTDLVDRLCDRAGSGWRSAVAGPHVSSQPCSRPPYALGMEVTIHALASELATTIRHICEHRNAEVPDGLNTLPSQAQWLRRNVSALVVLPDGRECAEHLRRAITAAVHAVGAVEQEYRIPKSREEEMIARANRIDVDAAAVARMAHKLGDQACGLNRDRVDYLRRKGFLAGEQVDGKWWYKLGDVLAAHKRAREARSSRAATRH